jgi:hypothetical protein
MRQGKETVSDPYATVPTPFLSKLLNRAAGDSAIHRAIREEIRRRELRRWAINSAPDTETHLLFTAEEWSRTLQRVTPSTTRERTKFAVLTGKKPS